MLSFWQSLILGLMQGLTEFLPVSSSGHLVLVEKLMHVQTEELFFFNIMLHVGTLAAVFIYYWSDIVALLKKPFQKMTLMLIIATIPAVVVTVLFGDKVEAAFSGKYLGFCFLVTAIILFASEYFAYNRYPRPLAKMNWLDAVVIGVAQAFAIFPGISRSGSTIAAALTQGIDRREAGKFSMLMSSIAIVGSVVLEAPKVISSGLVGVSVGSLVGGMLAAAISGYFAIGLLMFVLKKGGLRWFSFYMLAIALVTLGSQFIWGGALAM